MDMYYNFSLGYFLSVWDYLTEDDIRACLEYCAHQRCLGDKPLNFCQRCTLDKRPEEGPSVFLDSSDKFNEYMRNPHGKGQAFLGNEEDYEQDCIPENLWEFAAECLRDLSSCPIARRQ